MELVENAAVKLTVSNNFAAEITARLERTEIIRDNRHSKDVLICWDHSEMKVLAEYLDHFLPSQNVPKIPSPMERDYDWPGLRKPFDHQRDSVSTRQEQVRLRLRFGPLIT
jgi:hypothetical protein